MWMWMSAGCRLSVCGQPAALPNDKAANETSTQTTTTTTTTIGTRTATRTTTCQKYHTTKNGC